MVGVLTVTQIKCHFFWSLKSSRNWDWLSFRSIDVCSGWLKRVLVSRGGFGAHQHSNTSYYSSVSCLCCQSLLSFRVWSLPKCSWNDFRVPPCRAWAVREHSCPRTSTSCFLADTSHSGQRPRICTSTFVYFSTCYSTLYVGCVVRVRACDPPKINVLLKQHSYI